VYGLRLAGLPAAGDLLIDLPDDWPLLTIERATSGQRPIAERLTPDHATLWLSGGGFAQLDRTALTARMRVPEGTSDAALVHPYLAPVALVTSWWLGRTGFHGGAIVADGGVWAVLGEKTAGKSTLLASLALAGIDVMSDDVLIFDGGSALAGPRSIDLRADAAQRLGVGEPLGEVGARERWRLSLGAVPASLPMRGWLTLGWGDAVTVAPVRGHERLAALLPHQGVRIGSPDPSDLLELAALPHWQVIRPRAWDALAALNDRLLEAIAG
jgi:hypothetical protein